VCDASERACNSTGFWSARTFSSKVQQQSKIEAFAPLLPAGISSFTYIAIVNASGLFTMPATLATSLVRGNASVCSVCQR
jgi:hypothetical protein